MKYRDAKRLQPGDNVIRLVDMKPLQVIDIEVYGSVKKIRINCKDWNGSSTKFSLFQNEIV